MKRLMLLIAIALGTVAAMSATASTASADHSRCNSPRYSSSYSYSRRPSYGYNRRPSYSYSRSYYGPSRYDYRSPSYRYGYRPYYGNSFGYYGSGFSLRIGF